MFPLVLILDLYLSVNKVTVFHVRWYSSHWKWLLLMQLHTETAGCGYARQRTQWKKPNDKHMKDWKVFPTNLEPPNRFSWKWRLENVTKKVMSSQSYYRVYKFHNHFTWRPIVSQHLHPCSMHVCIFMLCIRNHIHDLHMHNSYRGWLYCCFKNTGIWKYNKLCAAPDF